MEIVNENSFVIRNNRTDNWRQSYRLWVANAEWQIATIHFKVPDLNDRNFQMFPVQNKRIEYLNSAMEKLFIYWI